MFKDSIKKLKAYCESKTPVRFAESDSGLADAVQIVLALVMIVVVGAIGIFIADETLTATGTPTNSHLNNMSTNIVSAGDTGSAFIIVLVIAFIGGVAISYMFTMMGKKAQ